MLCAPKCVGSLGHKNAWAPASARGVRNGRLRPREARVEGRDTFARGARDSPESAFRVNLDHIKVTTEVSGAALSPRSIVRLGTPSGSQCRHLGNWPDTSGSALSELLDCLSMKGP